MSAETLIDQMASVARPKFGSDREWARAAGVRAETLSRVRHRGNCDFATLRALAEAAGFQVLVAPTTAAPLDEKANNADGVHMPRPYGRDEEARLLDLCARPVPDIDHWRAAGPGFFMGGLATMLASERGFDRARHLALAEALHPGITTPEAFTLWLERSPLRPSRFLPMLAQRRVHAT